MITCQFFLFAKTHGSFLIQSTNIILWATFTLYSINLHYFRSILSFFFGNITPWTANNISKPFVNFKSWCNAYNWIVYWFADLFMWAKVQKTAPKHLFWAFWRHFLTRQTPENQFLRKMPNLLSFTLYYYIYKVSCQTN